MVIKARAIAANEMAKNSGKMPFKYIMIVMNTSIMKR